jgi:hypothetical protein
MKNKTYLLCRESDNTDLFAELSDLSSILFIAGYILGISQPVLISIFVAG